MIKITMTLVTLILLALSSPSFAGLVVSTAKVSIREALINGTIESDLQQIRENMDQCNSIDRYGIYPLHYAATLGLSKTVKEMIEAGVSVHTTILNTGQRKLYRNELLTFLWHQTGSTALHCAVMNGNMEIVRALMATDININAIDKWGNTALHFAAMNGKPEVVEILLAAGADANAAANLDNDPVEECAVRTHMFESLTDSPEGYTPLQLAKMFQHPTTVVALQPDAIVHTHINEGLRWTRLGRQDLAVRSYRWAANSIQAGGHHAIFAQRQTESGNHLAAAIIYIVAGDQLAAAKSYLLAQDFKSAFQNFREVFAGYAAAAGKVENTVADLEELLKSITQTEAEASAAYETALVDADARLEAVQTSIKTETALIFSDAANAANHTNERDRHAANEPIFRASAVEIDAALERILAEAAASRVAAIEARDRAIAAAAAVAAI